MSSEILSYRKSEEGVALFIDWENLKIGLRENHNLTPDIDLLLETIDKYGQRGTSKAYANWQHHPHLHDDQSRFLMRSVETVQILGRNPNNGRVIKNSADVAMAVEAVRFCYTQPDLTTFVLVTGDGDLVHLVNELKRNRNKVVIIGVGTSISRVLSEAADEVLLYERDIVKKQERKTVDNTLEPSTVYSWIKNILHNYKAPGITLPALGQQLWRKHHFAAKQLNMNLSDLIDSMVAAGHINLIDEKVFLVENSADQTLLQTSDNALSESVWQRLKEHQNRKDVLKVKVNHAIETGLEGKLEAMDVEAFLPNNQLDLKHGEETSMYVGQVLDAHVIEVDSIKERVVLSCSSVKAIELAKARQELLTNLKVGDVVKGKVVEITDFGAFVDLGGLDGLIHKSEFSHTRIKHPQQVVSIGEEVEVEVVKIDKRKEHVSLSIKRLQNDPWYDLAKKYPIGTQVTGKITNVVSYGAFVELEQGLSALIHISELEQVEDPSEVLQKGQEVETEVIAVNEAKKRLSLKLQQTDNFKRSSIQEQGSYFSMEDDEALGADSSAKQQLLVFESNKSPNSSKRDNLKLKNSSLEVNESTIKTASEKALLATITPENSSVIESGFDETKKGTEIAHNNDQDNELFVSASQDPSQEINWLIDFLRQHSQPYLLKEVFESLNKKHGLEQASFKASIKQAHKDGLIKLVRHTKSKKLYTTLSDNSKGNHR